MNKEELYEMILEDMVHGDIYEPNSMIKGLIALLTPEAVEEFARQWGYFDMRESDEKVSAR